MNKIAIGTIVVGIIIIIIGIIVIGTGLKGASETAEEGVLYEDIEGTMDLKGEKNAEPHLYVHIKSKYAGGMTGGYNERHGNDTWNLTADDCDLVSNFTLTNTDGDQIFIPRCNYVQDITGDDEWIVVGTLCKQYIHYGENKRNTTTGSGCNDGTYTWDIKGNEVMVYDADMLGAAIVEGFLSLLGSFGACCCGSLVLIIGIILAFTMEDTQAQTFDTSSNHPLTNNKDDGFTSYERKGWDEQEDYIRKETSEDATTEKEDSEEETKKSRSGEYEMPPPPEN
jgi:hypothetical protein